MKIIKIALAVVLPSFACFATYASDVGALPKSQNVQESIADPALVDQCIGAAISSGYGDGQCAYSFIKACVTTRSRNEMAKALQVDRMLGAVGRGCPNMPTNYSERFNAIIRAKDKF